MEAEGVGRLLHLDVFMIVVIVINIYGMTGQNIQNNVVIIINVYAKQKHVSTVLPVHIKTKQVLPVLVKNVLQENMNLVVKVKHQKMKHVLNVIPARFPQKDRQNVQHA